MREEINGDVKSERPGSGSDRGGSLLFFGDAGVKAEAGAPPLPFFGLDSSPARLGVDEQRDQKKPLPIPSGSAAPEEVQNERSRRADINKNMPAVSISLERPKVGRIQSMEFLHLKSQPRAYSNAPVGLC